MSMSELVQLLTNKTRNDRHNGQSFKMKRTLEMSVVIRDLVRHMLQTGEYLLSQILLPNSEVLETACFVNAGILFLWDIILVKVQKRESIELIHQPTHSIFRHSGASSILMENGDEERLKLQLRILREVLEPSVKFFP
jgi:hypothetical protein